MPNNQVDTGHGATITLATSGLTLNFTSMDLGENTINDVETSHLGTTGERTYMPGDLTEPGELVLPFQWDAEAGDITIGTVETVTVTFPVVSGGSTAATLAGTGYIKRVKRPNLQTDTLQDGELTIKWDGLTGPTYTNAA